MKNPVQLVRAGLSVASDEEGLIAVAGRDQRVLEHPCGRRVDDNNLELLAKQCEETRHSVGYQVPRGLLVAGSSGDQERPVRKHGGVNPAPRLKKVRVDMEARPRPWQESRVASDLVEIALGRLSKVAIDKHRAAAKPRVCGR